MPNISISLVFQKGSTYDFKSFNQSIAYFPDLPGYHSLVDDKYRLIMAYWLTIELEHGRIAPIPEAMDVERESLVYGTTVPQILNQLDRITQDLGLEKIDSFIYRDPQGYTKIRQEAEAEGNAVLASAMRAEISILAKQDRWHEPTVARRTIHSLKEFLATNPHILPGRDPLDTAKWTLWDLEAYDRILADAENRGLKFAFVERNDFN
jgi:hypothetical protein